MIVSAHQPHYLPWLGYIHRISLTNFFVIMDNMEFTSYHYINRNRIIQNNLPLLLTLPVKNKKNTQQIKDVKIDASHTFKGTQKQLKSIKYNYNDRAGFESFFPELEQVLSNKYEWLIDLDMAVLYTIIKYLKIDTNIILASERGIGGEKESELFLSLLNETKSKKILLGLGGSKKYIDSESIEKLGGEIVYQQFEHPIYPQNSREFIPGVSILDLLLNVSRTESIQLLKDCGSIKEKTNSSHY